MLEAEMMAQRLPSKENNGIDDGEKSGESAVSISAGKRLAHLQLAKFILVDFPVQIALVNYLLSWYDRSGVRCQMCLFDLEHCHADNLWHLGNIAVILFILGSAGLTMMLLMKYHKDRTLELKLTFFACLRI